MEKIKITVPGGMRFLSDWEDFKLSNFPNKCIINKQIPGCGFTEYCINGPEYIILCSPRKMLLKNKFDQHMDDVYLVVNEMDKDPGVDKDIDKDTKSANNILEKEKELSTVIKRDNKEIYKKIYEEIETYRNRRVITGRPMKVLVTYDSYHIVVDILKRLNIYHLFYTVIDEFQSILHDARFKSDTEMSFINTLQTESSTAYFVSATPMLDEYLEMLDEFKDLPYFNLDWGTADPSRVIKPSLKVLTMKSVGTKAEEILRPYLDGDFEEIVVMRDGFPTRVVCDEAVLYVNSVNHIISIIKKLKIRPEQVNILCADTEDNRKKIKKKLGKDYDIGSVPLKGEKPKLITLCTRTVYLGADFYSLCAQSYILSDSNVESLAVDISEDLPQILGRQRLFENPWKNSATFYYRSTANYKKMKWEDFENIIKKKYKDSEDLLKAYNETSDLSVKDALARKYQKDAINSSYKDDYVAVNKYNGVDLIPVFNNLVMINELRAFKIQQIDYKDRFTVFSTIHNTLTPDDIINQQAVKFMEEYNSMTEARKKLIFLCESNLPKEVVDIILAQIPDSDYIKSYYLTLGPEKLKNLGYKRNNIEKALGIVTFSDELLYDSIYSDFKEGGKYLLSDIKSKLTSIYSYINYSATPKAKDLEKYFDVKESTMRTVINGEKKTVKYYELIKSKEKELRQELKYAN